MRRAECNAKGNAKIIDFGTCKYITKGPCETILGTPEFMAPEILHDKAYGTAVDWWAAGIIMFHLVCGSSPYKSKDEESLIDEIKLKNQQTEIEFPSYVSTECKKFCLQLLEIDPSDRLGGDCHDKDEIISDRKNYEDDIRRHKIFQQVDWNNLKRSTDASTREDFSKVNFDSVFTRVGFLHLALVSSSDRD